MQPLSVDDDALLLALSGEVGFRWQLEAELPSLQFRISRSIAQASVRLEVPDGQQGWRQVALGAEAVDDRLARRLALEEPGAVAALWFGAPAVISDLAAVSAADERPDWLEVSDTRRSTSQPPAVPPPSAGLADLVDELRQVRLSDALAAAESRLMMGSLAFSAEDDGMVQLHADLERASKAAAALGPIRQLTDEEEDLLASLPPSQPPRPPLQEALTVWWRAESRAWVPIFVGKLLALILFVGAAAGSRTMGKMLPLNAGLLAWAAWGANRLFDRRATGRPLLTPLFVRVNDPVGDARAALVEELGCDSLDELADRNRQRELAEARRERAELALTSMGGAVGGGASPSDGLSPETIRQARAQLVLSGRTVATIEHELRSMGLEPEALLQVESAAGLTDALASLRQAGGTLGIWNASGPAPELLVPWTAVLRQTLGREVVAVASGPVGGPPVFRDSTGTVNLNPGEAARALALLRIVMVRAAVSRRKEGALAMMVTAGMMAGAEAAERRLWRKMLSELSPSLQVICIESVG